MTRIYPFQRTARWISLAFLAAALLLGGWAKTSAQDTRTPDRPENDLKNEVKTRNFDLKRKVKSDEPAPALSPHHAMLNKLAGHWTVQVRMYPEPGGEPIDSRGAVRNEVILGGRALKSEFKGDFMGQPFAGMGLEGYDLDKGQHFGIWMDSTTTGASFESGGECNHEGQDVVTIYGEAKHPQTGEPLKKKTILTLRSTVRYTYEEWHTPQDGEETLAMQVIYSKTQ
jgi:hypothetical protein